MTCTTLSRRLTTHLQNGAIKNHYDTYHRATVTRRNLEEGTNIIDREQDPRRLLFLEALHILQLEPSINIQTQDFKILPTLKRKPTTIATSPGSSLHGASQSQAGSPGLSAAPLRAPPANHEP